MPSSPSNWKKKATAGLKLRRARPRSCRRNGKIVSTAIQNIEGYLESFTGFAKRAAGHNLPWLRKLREDGFARFCETGFPTTHDEDWRFTNISAIARTPFRLAPEGKVTIRQVEQFQLPGSLCRLVFVDGHFVRELSSIEDLPAGLKVGGLAEVIKSNSSGVESHLGHYLNTQRDAFSSLNTAFAEDGAYVHVRKGSVLEAPIHLLFISTASNEPQMTHPRNL